MTDDELLTPKPVAANEALKADVLARTVRRVRFATWRRRALAVAVCVACFGLGWATTFLRPARELVYIEVPGAPVPVADARGSIKPDPASREHQRRESAPDVLSPAQLELLAEQTTVKAESARRFRDAGDRYLKELADYRAALRCYRNFLDEADPVDRAVTPDDTWLLTSLKRAREQESTQ